LIFEEKIIIFEICNETNYKSIKTMSKMLSEEVYVTPQSYACEADYDQFIAASGDLRDMDVRQIYDEGF
jgi:hypothetical protein